MADHTVSHQHIDSTKRAPFSWRRFGWQLLIFLTVVYKMVSQQIELCRFVHVNAYKLARLAPEPFGQRFSVGNRLIEMRRRHVKPMSLPGAEQVTKLRALAANGAYPRNEPGWLHHIALSPSRLAPDCTSNT